MTAPLGQFDRVTLHDAYECWRTEGPMRDILTQFGGRTEQQLTATQMVRWEPSQDSYSLVGRDKFDVQPRGQSGLNQLSLVRSKHLRAAGVNLILFAKDDVLCEDLISRVVLSLESCFGSEANCRVLGGAWDLARAHSTSCERYVLRVVVALPVIRILPAALVASTPTTYEVQTP